MRRSVSEMRHTMSEYPFTLGKSACWQYFADQSLAEILATTASDAEPPYPFLVANASSQFTPDPETWVTLNTVRPTVSRC